MLRNTFVHIPGIGLKTEQQLWAAGIRSWDDVAGPAPAPPGVPAAKLNLIAAHSERLSDSCLQDPGYFADLLSSSHHWRLFPHFREATAYLDIETTGTGWDDCITTIALYDGTTVATYVQGRNLEDFVEDIRRYEALVTYNGKCFDIPIIERYFGIRLEQVHLDLRFLLHQLGYRGGLKGCERQLGLDRGELDGVDGYFAVLLWQEYQRSGNPAVLETLLAYNVEDTVNLETLMVYAFNLNLQQTPFEASHRLPLPSPPMLPYRPDRHLLDRLKARLQAF